MSHIITLTADFGDDAFAVAQLQAVINNINPEALVINATDSLQSFNLIEGAFVLQEMSKLFSKFSRAIHVGVVDPGVGSARKPIIIETENALFVVPDNGLLLPAAKANKLLGVWEIDTKAVEERLNKSSLTPKPIRISNTFHGRDIFAPVAAFLSQHRGLEFELGRLVRQKLKNFQDLEFLPDQVVFIDPYGNIKINNPAQYKLGQNFRFRVRNKLTCDCWHGHAKFCRTFDDVAKGEFLFYLGSNWNLELAINLGSAAKKINAAVGDIIEIEKTYYSGE